MNTPLAYNQSSNTQKQSTVLKLAYKTSDLFYRLEQKQECIAVVGLGYVGLPLAIHMGSKFKVTGFDINRDKIIQLLNHQDPCKEIQAENFKNKDLQFSYDESVLSKAKLFIVAVPTPIDMHKQPNLEPLKMATAAVARHLKKGDCVVFESTVFPGCTNEICVPILERISRLKYNKDFTVGYSPERINPGDKKHTFTKIKKIVSGSNTAALDLIANVYESVVEAGVHRATSIKVAEAAKVVENIQRDVNIGLMNELSQIFNALDIDTKDVLQAAGTKWNFHHYYPGLVGGHCIGVDPYYMIERAKRFNVKPNILETVRSTNEGMVDFIVKTIIKRLWSKSSSTKFKVLVKGITFKEDVNDIRNSKVIDIIKYLQRSGFELVIKDPHANAQEVKAHYGLDLNTQPLEQEQFDVIIMAVNHREYAALDSMVEHLKPQGFLFDIRGTFKHLVPSHKYQTL